MDYKSTKHSTSVGTRIHDEKILKAKKFLKEKYNNKYDTEPHFNFIIMAMPNYRVTDLEILMDDYFNKKSPIALKLKELHFDPKQKFFSIPISGEEVMNVHKELLEILNSIRDGYIREKDLERMQDGRTNDLENEYINKYGYLRVLSKFTPHITVGNIQTENFDISDVKKQLDEMLEGLYNSTLKVEKVLANLIEDAKIQSDYKWIWEKEYHLKNLA